MMHPTKEQTKFWHAPEIGQVELLKARYITHSFAPHTHEGYAIGVIVYGAEAFIYKRGNYVAPAGSVVVINPGEVHTGHAVDEVGWKYRMIYPEASLLQNIASELKGRPTHIPDFQAAVIDDPELAQALKQLHLTLECSESAIEKEEVFNTVLAQLIIRYADERLAPTAIKNQPQSVQRARQYLEANYHYNISLKDLAHHVNLSPFYLSRVFRKMVGLPPHAYLTQLRIQKAKMLLRLGLPIAQVALNTGFVDQSHLNRHFKRIVGVTPGQYVM